MSPIRSVFETRGAPGSRAPSCLLALMLLFGCGSGDGARGNGGGGDDASHRPETEPTASASPAGPSAPRPDEAGDAAVPRFEELPVLFPVREQRQPKGVRYHMRKADPVKAGWTTEVFAEAAEAELERFFEDLLNDSEALAARVAEDWQGATTLVPEQLDVDFDDGALEIRRGMDPEGGHTVVPGADGLTAIAAEVLQRFARHPARSGDDPGEPGSIGVEAHIVSVVEEGSAYETRAMVQLARRGSAPLQHDITLAVDWRAEDPAQPVLVGFELTGFEEARSTAPLFADVTRYAFGGARHYDSQILRGVGEFLGRTDRAAGMSFQGMQGVSVGDANGDGIDDVYVCQQVGLPNQLLLGSRDGTFTDVAAESRVDFIDLTRAALFIDWDNDGDQDLVLAMATWLLLCPNDGTGAFDKPTLFKADGGAHFINLSAADADGDGDLDLYAGRYSVAGVMRGAPKPYHNAGNGAPSYLFRNDGPGEMVDVTEESGLGVENTRYTLASIWDDVDGDGDMDLYVVNDFGRNNLFQNDGTGHFVDIAADSGALDIGAGMGASIADYDLDGDLDIYVTNMWSAAGQRIVQQSDKFLGGEQPDLHRWYTKHASGNSVLANRGDGSFEDVTGTVGAGLGRWAWGGKFVDFDNDAYEDIYVPCGQTTKKGATYDLEGFFWRGVISHTPLDGSPKPEYDDAFTAIHYLLMHRDFHWSGEERNVAYQNLGGGRFADVSVVSGADFLDDGRSAAVLDWDDDGRLDMVLKSRTAPRVRLMHNRSGSENASVSFDLQGVTCNRDAIGARITLEVGGRRLVKRVVAGDGYLAQSSKRAHFGLGKAQRIERVTVDWPDGTQDVYGELSAGARYRIVQGGDAPVPVPARPLTVDPRTLPDREPEPNDEPVARVPLFEMLPMMPFPLPSREQPTRRVGDYRGSPLVVHIWTASHPSGEAGLAQVARARELAAGTGARFVALSVDEGPYLARAGKAATAAGLETGYADGRALAVYEVVAFEVLEMFEDLPLPFTMVLDRGGKLVSVYCGIPPADELARDLRLVAQNEAAALVELRGGLQVVARKRRLSQMAKIFETAGAVELAEFYRRLREVDEAAGDPESPGESDEGAPAEDE